MWDSSRPAGGGDDESDSDIAAMGARVTLRDPLSATRMKRPARYVGCQGLVSFDLDTFLQMAAQSRKWTCPICKAAGPPSMLREDTYLASIVAVLEVRGDEK